MKEDSTTPRTDPAEFAKGATVKPTKGGTQVFIGKDMKEESVVDTGTLNEYIGKTLQNDEEVKENPKKEKTLLEKTHDFLYGGQDN